MVRCYANGVRPFGCSPSGALGSRWVPSKAMRGRLVPKYGTSPLSADNRCPISRYHISQKAVSLHWVIMQVTTHFYLTEVKKKIYKHKCSSSWNVRKRGIPQWILSKKSSKRKQSEEHGDQVMVSKQTLSWNSCQSCNPIGTNYIKGEGHLRIWFDGKTM